MKLYEVNMAIMEVIESYVDLETGELLGDPEEMQEQLDMLEMEKDRILEYLARIVLNDGAEEGALKEEIDRLVERKRKLTRHKEKILKIIDRECAGTKRDLGIATVNYRKSTTLEIDDEEKAVNWLNEHGHEDCVKVAKPTVSKEKAKPLLTKGNIEIPGLRLEEHNNMSLK